MPTFREAIWPIIAVIIASAIIMFALDLLDNSDWADSMRAGISVEAEGGEGDFTEEGESPINILSIIGPLLKITIFMGLPGLITLAVLRLTRRFGKQSAAGAAPS